MGKRITIRWHRDRAGTPLKDDGMRQQIEDSPGGAEPKAHSALRRRKVRIVRAKRGFEPRQAADRAHQVANEGPLTAQIAQFKGTSEELIRPELEESGRKPVLARPERCATWDVEKANDMRSRGCTWGEIAKTLNVSPTSVRNYLIRHGLYETKKQLKMQWDVQEALKLWRDGLSSREVAARVGTAEPNVRKAFMRRGWLDGSTSRLTWDIKRARQLREDGLSLREVAARVGTFTENLKKAFMRRGWLDGNTSLLSWDIEEARRLRKQGLSWAEIGKRVSAHSTYVWRAFKRRGWLEEEKTPLLKWDAEEALRLWKNGLSFRDVAARVGTAEVNVRMAFKRRGWLDSNASRLTWDIEEARRLWKEGRSLKEIAAQVGTFAENLRKAFARRGWLDGNVSHLTWDIEEARRLRRQGLSWRNVAERVGAHPAHVWRAFHRRGWLEDKKTSLLKWGIEEALSLWKEGLSFTEVAARVGTAEPNVRKAFMRRGWMDGSTSRLTWDIKQARQLREAGLSWDEIGAQVGTAGTNVRDAFIRRGWRRDPGLPNPGEAEDVSTSKAEELSGFRKTFEENWDIEEARRLREQGLSWKAVADRVGCSDERRVWRRFKRLGWLDDEEISHPAKLFRGKWDIEEARRLRKQGLTWKEVANRVGCSRSNVRQAFRQWGRVKDEGISIPSETDGKSDSGNALGVKWDIEEARRLRKQGLSWREVASRVGCSKSNVRLAFQRQGWLDDEEISHPGKPFRGKWDIDEARRLRKEGLSLGEIAALLGCSRQNLWQTLGRRRSLDEDPTSNPEEASQGDE